MNIGIIPARLASSRFPKKILTILDGKPMIAHVMEKALEAEKLDKVILAIDSEET
ncbi:MAG: 3-deoxy-manno-octulosonate cytidylyltransferase, partial [Candidatus Neomarinimicrobiota bacterium]|nr:3-deoxy-manno-octulosonate cytidylyltransferase [Candidatus Neomarinimicrobiota bacterium]